MGMLILTLVTLIMALSVRVLLTLPWEGYIFSLKNFLHLSYVYGVLLLGFASIYTILVIEGIEAAVPVEEEGFWPLFLLMLYFSAMMLFSVGNGEIVPVGAGRLIAALSAFIGHILPVTVVWTIIAKSDEQTFEK
ncbi:ion channel [Jeotgalibacillus sp. R-1-5s-1]|uniref:ion channel n=1 Tax=Jeotgalibacillus sp. R-1-5s-1 TaxID=2555897 RepID=UPI00106CFF36|nr:ion channel [Jeotgalibacillus sp. R-1-5s-1]TFE01253.1 two pore domain potassium channel family protein [Jeotgalibacillus sp. R-1-5s-1]